MFSKAFAQDLKGAKAAQCGGNYNSYSTWLLYMLFLYYALCGFSFLHVQGFLAQLHRYYIKGMLECSSSVHKLASL